MTLTTMRRMSSFERSIIAPYSLATRQIWCRRVCGRAFVFQCSTTWYIHIHCKLLDGDMDPYICVFFLFAFRLIVLLRQPVESKKTSLNAWHPPMLDHSNCQGKRCANRALIELVICQCRTITIVNLKIGFCHCLMKCWRTRKPSKSFGHHRRLFKGNDLLLIEWTENHRKANQYLHAFFFGHRLGERINDESSIYYWAAKNKIPVFSPALTDGSLGDMMYFHSHRNPGLVVDILSDLKRLNTMAVKVSLANLYILNKF